MRKSILLVLCCLLSTVLYAGPVSKEQARQIASQFLTAKGGAHRAPAQLVEQPPVLNAVDKAGNPYIYAFNAGHDGGYVLVSGDDRFVDVLGYSNSGSFDNDNMPDNMRAWLQGYVDEMKYYESVGYQPSKEAATASASSSGSTLRRAVKAPILPLLTTAWGQGDPYNLQCPVFFNGKLSVTGCVATAMAQVVCYTAKHAGNQPTTLVKDIPGYTCSTEWSGHGKLSVAGVSKDTTTFDWGNMRDVYRGVTYTDAQANAVAKLMACCGKSVKMDYSSNESAANTSDVAKALITYFGFDKTTKAITRSDYSYAQWIELMYAELAAGRPVQYGGTSSGGGHSFVVDGYDGDEMFHVNWGWNGSPDSYYALSVLNPDDNSGIGASSSNDGYSFNQRAIVGIQYGTGQQGEATPIMLSASNLRVNGQHVIFEAFNYTGAMHSFNFGIGFMDEKGTITPSNIDSHDDWETGYGWDNFDFEVPTETTKAGQTFKIVPISKESSADTWYTGCNTDIHYWEAKYDAYGVPTLTAHPIPILGATFNFTGSKYVNEVQPVEVTLTNQGDEFYGVLYLFASTTSTKGDPVTKGGVTVQKNKSATMTFEWTPESTGSYNIWITTDEDGENVIGQLTGEHQVNIITKPSEPDDPSLAGKDVAIMSCTYENQDDASYSVDANGVRSIDVLDNNITITAIVKNFSSSPVTRIGFKLEKYDEEKSGFFPLDDYYSWYTSTLDAGASKRYTHTEENLDYGKYRIKLVMITVNNKNEITNITVLDDRYTCNLVMSYSATNENGETVRYKVTSTDVTVGESVAAIDLSGIDFTDVTPNKNPNTLYIIGSEQTAPESLDGKNVVKGGVAEQITLTDGHAFYSPVDFTAKNISYTRTESTYYNKETKKGWTTLVLPFAPAGIKTYVGETKYDLTWFTGAEETDKNLWLMKFDDEHGGIVNFGYAGLELEANKPYIMALPGDSYGNKWSLEKLPITFYAANAAIKANAKATTVGTNYKFVGTTLSKTNLTDIYKLNADGDQFVLGTTASIEPFRAYFAPTSTAATATELSIGFGRNVITNVLELKGVTEVKDADNNSIYNMNGQRVAQPKKGLYIVNGKKVVIK